MKSTKFFRLFIALIAIIGYVFITMALTGCNDGGSAPISQQPCADCGELPCECPPEPCDDCGELPCECPPEPCDDCGELPCECPTEPCDVCGELPCECPPEPCDVCGELPCECPPEPCDVCGELPCECPPEPCDVCGEPEADCTCDEGGDICDVCGELLCECPQGDINISFVISGNNLELYQDNSVLSLNADDHITITGEGDFDSYDIFVDGVFYAHIDEPEIDYMFGVEELYNFAINELGYSEDRAFGLYKIMIVVRKNGVPYSSEISVTLEP